MRSVTVFLMSLLWIVGIVVSKGFWSAFFAVFVPPYSWYLAIEWILILNGWA